MERDSLCVAICGRLGESESHVVEAALAGLPASALVRRLQGPPGDWPATIAGVDLCIVLQSWPDEFPATTVRDLLSACATARLVCCQGAWCASTGRTGSAWPLAVCTPVERLASRLTYEVGVLRGERDPLPFTASRDEIFAALYAAGPDSTRPPIEVRSHDRTYARELERAFGARGESTSASVTVVDLDPWHPELAEQVAEMPQGRPVIGVAGFPGSGQRDAGTVDCLSKLEPLVEFQARFEGVTRGAPHEE